MAVSPLNQWRQRKMNWHFEDLLTILLVKHCGSGAMHSRWGQYWESSEKWRKHRAVPHINSINRSRSPSEQRWSAPSITASNDPPVETLLLIIEALTLLFQESWLEREDKFLPRDTAMISLNWKMKVPPGHFEHLMHESQCVHKSPIILIMRATWISSAAWT